jgi:hypothetical protein
MYKKGSMYRSVLVLVKLLKLSMMQVSLVCSETVPISSEHSLATSHFKLVIISYVQLFVLPSPLETLGI